VLTLSTELQLVLGDVAAAGIFCVVGPYVHVVPFDTHFAQGIWRSHLVLASMHAKHERLRERLVLVRIMLPEPHETEEHLLTDWCSSFCV